MLSQEERARIFAEEALKAEIRAELRAKPKPPAESWWSALLASDNFRWFMGALAIPGAVGLWGHLAKDLAQKEHAAQELRDRNERDARLQVEMAQRSVDLVIKLLPSLNQAPGSVERLNAIAVLQALYEEGALPPPLRVALDRVKAEINDAVVNDRFSNAASRLEAEAIAQASTTPRSHQLSTGGAPAAEATVMGSRVFIQILAESQRPEAAALQAVLRKEGIAVPGIENVVATARRAEKPAPASYEHNVLLVFHEGDAALARQIAELAAKSGVELRIAQRWQDARFASVPKGQLEIWFASAGAPTLTQR